MSARINMRRSRRRVNISNRMKRPGECKSFVLLTETSFLGLPLSNYLPLIEYRNKFEKMWSEHQTHVAFHSTVLSFLVCILIGILAKAFSRPQPHRWSTHAHQSPEPFAHRPSPS